MRGSTAQEGLNCSRRNVLMVGLAVFAAALSAFTSVATEQETASTVPIRRTARHHQRWRADLFQRLGQGGQASYLATAGR